MIHLTHYAHLIALAEECHFARAAKRVHLSQPAFSRSIQTLERHTGLQLFERHRGGVRPTPAGQFLIEKASRLLQEARSVQREVELLRDGQLGDIAFGLGPFPAATLLREALAHLRTAFPRICLRVEINNWQRLLERLRREDIEFFVAATSDIANLADIQIEPLMHQRVNLYVRKTHPLPSALSSLAEVWDFGVAATKLTPSVTAFLERFLQLPHGAPLKIAVQCDDIGTLHSLALNTDTVIVTTDLAIQRLRHQEDLRVLDIDGFPMTHADIGIVTLRQRTLAPMAHHAIEALRGVALD
jgi:DNA-binding transcriptional LysR family regulator